MRPFAGRGLEVPTSIADELAAYLRLAGSKLSPVEALGQAIRTWIAHEREMPPEGRISPRGMTLAIAGEGRNAWRAALARVPSTSAHTPAASDSIAAAAAMTDALRTALTLVEHAHAQAARPVERRVERQRRDGDVGGENCPFD